MKNNFYFYFLTLFIYILIICRIFVLYKYICRHINEIKHFYRKKMVSIIIIINIFYKT